MLKQHPQPKPTPRVPVPRDLPTLCDGEQSPGVALSVPQKARDCPCGGMNECGCDRGGELSIYALGSLSRLCYALPMSNTFVNPFTDFGFKKIFGGDPAPLGGVLGSRQEASKPHLIDFLNSLLPAFAQIKDLTFKNLEQLPHSEDDRKAVYDVYCQGLNGEYFIVELQKIKQVFFKDRTLFYATFPIQDQAKKGDWDYKLEAVYCVGVLGFTFDDDKANAREVVHTVKLKDQNNTIFYDKLTFIYLEIPNFDKPLEALETRLDQWLYFIKNLEDLQSIPELFKDQVFINAFETAKMANLEPTERSSYEHSLKVLRDNYAALKTAIEEADAIGEARGREVGLVEGELKAKLEITKNLKAAGMSLVQIQAITGLSATDVEP